MSAASLSRAVLSGARRVARISQPAAAPARLPAASRLFGAAGSAVFAASFAPRSRAVAAMAAPSGGEQFTLPELPYAKDALEPHTSARTLDFHHGKHHATYVAGLNKALQAEGGSRYAGMPLDEVVKESFKSDNADGPVFNNGGQHWNHSFFWTCMKPGGGGAPPKAVQDALESSFGSIDAFKTQFKDAAVSQFGSGWAWLVHGEDGKLKIVKTPNAISPICFGQVPLLTCDVWEHAYYLDYQNKRGDFVQTFLDHLVNWEFVEQNMRKPKL